MALGLMEEAVQCPLAAGPRARVIVELYAVVTAL
jgi:hypothetical protein